MRPGSPPLSARLVKPKPPDPVPPKVELPAPGPVRALPVPVPKAVPRRPPVPVPVPAPPPRILSVEPPTQPAEPAFVAPAVPAAPAVLAAPAVPAAAVSGAGAGAGTGTGTEPASQPVAAPGGPDPGAIARYRLELMDLARRYRKYPRIAQDNNWEGRVELRIEIGKDGALAALSVRKGAGRAVLDEAAQAMIRAASSVAAIPPALRGQAFALEIPVDFLLKDEGK